MGSYPMRGSEHDFDANKSNKTQDTRSFPDSGMKAGVENGLSMVEMLPHGGIQAEQQTDGNAFRQAPVDSDLGTKNGKNFTLRY